jgi:hypothetical protein
MITRWFLLFPLSLVLISCAHRSVWRELRRDDQPEIRPGDRVRLVLKEDRSLEGKVVESTPEAVTIRATDHKGKEGVMIYTCRWEEILLLESEVISGSERWRSVRNGVLTVGVIIGLGLLLLSLATH